MLCHRESVKMSRTASVPSCRWEVRRGIAAIDGCAEAWNDLAQRSSTPFTANATWMQCFRRAFVPMDEEVAVHVLYRGPRPVIVLPLRRRGRLVGVWSALVNAHTPYWSCALDQDELGLGEDILDHLLAGGGVLDIGPVHSRSWICGELLEVA